MLRACNQAPAGGHCGLLVVGKEMDAVKMAGGCSSKGPSDLDLASTRSTFILEASEFSLLELWSHAARSPTCERSFLGRGCLRSVRDVSARRKFVMAACLGTWRSERNGGAVAASRSKRRALRSGGRSAKRTKRWMLGGTQLSWSGAFRCSGN